VSTPEFFKNLETLLRERSLEEWKTYLRWRWLHGAANRLSDAFAKENFSFFGP
jgi:predicted metalloendopeptidase